MERNESHLEEHSKQWEQNYYQTVSQINEQKGRTLE